jgi:putative flippase GtrA
VRISVLRPIARVLTLRNPGLPSRATRFAAAGGIVALTYVACTTLLATVVGLPFQLSLATGFAVALTLHFSLQRRFVWAHDDGYALPVHHQAARYTTVAIAQYLITVAATSTLPSVVGVSTTIIYLATTAIVSIVNFVLFRVAIFHPERRGDQRA